MAQTTLFQATRPVHCRGGSLSVTGLIVVTAVIAVSLQFLPIQASADVVTLQNATATYSQAAFGGFPAGMAIDGNFGSNNGWAIYEGTTGSGGTTPNMTHPQIAVFEAVANIGSAGGTVLTFTFHQLHGNPGHNIGRFRLSATTDDRSLFADGLSTGGDVTANWTILGTLSATSTGGATLGVLGDGSILASGPNPATSVYTVTSFTSMMDVTGFRLEVLADPSFPDMGPGRFANGNFHLTEFQVNATAVPEPAFGLLGSAIALGGIFLRRMRGRQRSI